MVTQKGYDSATPIYEQYVIEEEVVLVMLNDIYLLTTPNVNPRAYTVDKIILLVMMQ
jgi:hypothetical protein